jgi:hypothetical protein
MEHQLWKAIVALLDQLDKPRPSTRFDFADEEIVKTYYGAVIHDRPSCWACRKRNCPIHLRKRPLPSPATLSRRLRSTSVRTLLDALLDALERRVTTPKEPGLFWMIDGKPLPIGGCSKDRQAGYGRAAGGKAKGYKLHALRGADGSLAAWRIAPMNTDERVMAERLLKAAPAEVLGYVAADANYDSNNLHRLCDQRGDLPLVTPRRYGRGRGTGHREQSAGRLRSIALSEAPLAGLGQRLLADRAEIERQFGNLVNWGGGLTCLPAWVRTHRRVQRWVQAKLVLTRLKSRLKAHAQLTTCAA